MAGWSCCQTADYNVSWDRHDMGADRETGVGVGAGAGEGVGAGAGVGVGAATTQERPETSTDVK